MTRLHDIADRQPGWFADASGSQTDPEAFFPEKGGSTRPAKRICNRCQVRPECLAYALDNRIEPGVWGGASEQERKAMLRQRKTSVGGGQPC